LPGDGLPLLGAPDVRALLARHGAHRWVRVGGRSRIWPASLWDPASRDESCGPWAVVLSYPLPRRTSDAECDLLDERLA
jgi:hypothetical protein